MGSLRKNFFVTLGTLVSVLLVLGGTFLYLLNYQILPLSERLLEVLGAINIAENRKHYFVNIVRQDIEDGSGDIENIRKHFFAYTDRSAKEFIIFLEGAAARNNLPTEGMISSLPSGDPASTVLVVGGSYQNVMTFIRELENEQYLFRMESISLRAQGDQLSATIQFSLPKP